MFLSNREAVLEMLQRFSEDLTELQKAIRKGDGDMLFDVVHPASRYPLDHQIGGQIHGQTLAAAAAIDLAGTSLTIMTAVAVQPTH